SGTGATGSMLSYDEMGRPVSEWQCTPSTCPSSAYRQLSYGYDKLGDMTSSTDGVGHTFTSTFNAAGRLTQMTSTLADAQHPGTLLSNVAYGAFGPAWASFGNGWAESRAYHQRGWLQGQKDGPPTNNAPQPALGSVAISGSLQSYQQQTQWATRA